MEKATVRRSVAIPRKLMEEAIEVAPAALRNNWNSLVKEALKDYVQHRKANEFARAMEEMASDPAIAKSSEEINEEFLETEMDRL